jgi:hypothetical protein
MVGTSSGSRAKRVTSEGGAEGGRNMQGSPLTDTWNEKVGPCARGPGSS